jgi:hypothetical protein
MEQLRRSAQLWRTIVGAAAVLGGIGAIAGSAAAARDFLGQFNAGAFFLLLLIYGVTITLSLGLFFMITRIMDGLADLIGQTRSQHEATMGTHPAAAGMGSPAPTPLRQSSRPEAAAEPAIAGEEVESADSTPAVKLRRFSPETAVDAILAELGRQLDAPVTVDLAGCSGNYLGAVQLLLSRIAGRGQPGTITDIKIINATPGLADIAIAHARRSGWSWAKLSDDAVWLRVRTD